MPLVSPGGHEPERGTQSAAAREGSEHETRDGGPVHLRHGQVCKWASSDPTVLHLCHPAADWIHPGPLLRGFMRCRLSLHTPTFDSLPLALFAMLDSHSSDCDFDFVAFTFSAQTSPGRSESSSHSHLMQGGWSVLVQLCSCMETVGFPLLCLHGSIVSGWWCWRLWVRIKQMWQNSADNEHFRHSSLWQHFRFLQ